MPALAVLSALLAACLAGHAGAGDPAENSGTPCIGLSKEACYADARCEAIPYWGESLVACVTDERGFSANCPYEGCRPLHSDCPSLDYLIKNCPQYCSYNNFSIDPKTGCRMCGCRR